MGEEVSGRLYSHQQKQLYREKVQQGLNVFAQMLRQGSFDFRRPLTGMEVELNLVDEHYQPALRNREVLSQIADPAFQTELGAYNIELNCPPTPLPGTAAFELEESLRQRLNRAEQKAREVGCRIVMVGILPTLRTEHLTNHWMSDSARYGAINEAILRQRGEEILIDIEGVERLNTYWSSIAPESACTSMQLHLQVSPRDFPRYWNAAQVLCGPQVALGANSPYFLGRQLWAETRTELFLQATDTRPEELRNQGVRPRVWFGERWITSIFDLFEENVRYFPSLLPDTSQEDPVAVLESGQAPMLRELRLHNGTVYRWNRPVYDVLNGKAHLRIENRALPAGPTVRDIMANAAFYYGVVRVLAEDDWPVWSRMSFAAAEENFRECATWGLGAQVFWPGMGTVTMEELVLRRLLPMAYEGLDRWGVAPSVRDTYLGVIEGRVKSGINGAAWQASAVRALERQGLDRGKALTEMVRMYCEGMHSNVPVHEWPMI